MMEVWKQSDDDDISRSLPVNGNKHLSSIKQQENPSLPNAEEEFPAMNITSEVGRENGKILNKVSLCYW